MFKIFIILFEIWFPVVGKSKIYNILKIMQPVRDELKRWKRSIFDIHFECIYVFIQNLLSALYTNKHDQMCYLNI